MVLCTRDFSVSGGETTYNDFNFVAKNMFIDRKLEQMIIKASIATSNAVNKRFGVCVCVCNYLSPSGDLSECVGFILHITKVLEFL